MSRFITVPRPVIYVATAFAGIGLGAVVGALLALRGL